MEQTVIGKNVKTFNEVFTDIESTRKELDKKRLKHIAANKSVYIKLLILAAVVAVAAFLLWQPSMPAAIGVLVVGLAVIVYFAKSISLKFVDEVKQELIQAMLDSMGLGFKFLSKEHIDDSILEQAGIIPTSGRIEGANMIEGNGLVYSDIDVEHRSTEETGHVNMFKGNYLVYHSALPISGKTIIVEDSWGRKLKNFFKKNSLVRLETIDIKEKYAVYTDNETAARQLLTSEMIKKIELLDEACDGITLGFIDGKVHIATKQVRTDLWFNFNHSLLNEDTVKPYYQTIIGVLNLSVVLEK